MMWWCGDVMMWWFNRKELKEYRRFNSIYLYKINTCELITYESRKGFNVNRAAWNAAVDSTFVIINRKAVEYCFFILIQALQACWLWLRLFATIDFIDGYLILSPSGLCCVIAYTKSKIRMFRNEKITRHTTLFCQFISALHQVYFLIFNF